MRWNIFDDNTSTVEALIDFSKGGSKARFKNDCWPAECKSEINKIKNIKNARKNARRWLTKNGYEN